MDEFGRGIEFGIDILIVVMMFSVTFWRMITVVVASPGIPALFIDIFIDLSMGIFMDLSIGIDMLIFIGMVLSMGMHIGIDILLGLVMLSFMVLLAIIVMLSSDAKAASSEINKRINASIVPVSFKFFNFIPPFF